MGLTVRTADQYPCDSAPSTSPHLHEPYKRGVSLRPATSCQSDILSTVSADREYRVPSLRPRKQSRGTRDRFQLNERPSSRFPDQRGRDDTREGTSLPPSPEFDELSLVSSETAGAQKLPLPVKCSAISVKGSPCTFPMNPQQTRIRVTPASVVPSWHALESPQAT